MTGRGKPTTTRKPVLPNIAAAGRKKPETSEGSSVNGEAKVTNRGRGRGGNTRGRGRGRGGSSKASMIVQSESSITAGFSEGTLRSSRSSIPATEEVIGKLDKSVNINGVAKSLKIESNDNGKASDSESHEGDWQSDDDQDKIELYEILKPAFISDIKKGREMPVVLPQKDMSQFQSLVQDQKGITKEPKTEDVKCSQSEIKNPVDLMQKYINEQSNDLILMQLPASLDEVHQNFEETNPSVKMEIDQQRHQQPSSSTAQPDISLQKHCMDGLPAEAEIGKLQLLKNGQMRLVIGNYVMEMHEAIPSQMFETVVQTQTGSTNGGSTGSMTVLGNIGDSFLCTYNVP